MQESSTRGNRAVRTDPVGAGPALIAWAVSRHRVGHQPQFFGAGHFRRHDPGRAGGHRLRCRKWKRSLVPRSGEMDLGRRLGGHGMVNQACKPGLTGLEADSSDGFIARYFPFATSGRMQRRPYPGIAYEKGTRAAPYLAEIQATNGMIGVFPIECIVDFRPGHKVS